MILSVHELDPKDVRHLFCTDPRLQAELDAVNRSLQRLDECVTMWTRTEPDVAQLAEQAGSSSAAGRGKWAATGVFRYPAWDGVLPAHRRTPA